MTGAGNDPPLHFLRTFDVAARSPSFSVAARLLGISQPAVSQQIRQLELILDQQLFSRLGRGVELTEAGHNLAADVAPALARLERGLARFRAPVDDHRVAIRGNNTFLVRWLIPRIGSFLDEHPDVEVDLTASFWPEEPDDRSAVLLQAGRPVAGAYTIPGDQRMVAVASPSVAASTDWPDLGGRTILDVRGTPGWTAFADDLGLDVPHGPDRPRMLTSMTHLHTIELARRGLGIALAHHLVVADLVAEGDLRVLASAETAAAEPFYALFPSSDRITPATDRFRRWLHSAS